ncbi:MAG: SAM-dependent methyltransferase [Bacteriovorax sp.]
MSQNTEAHNFFYFLCNPGSESFLKEEIRLIYPELRFAYSTEGFLTFKEIRPLGKTLRPIFCRHFGRFLMRGTLEEVRDRASSLKKPVFFYSKDGEIFEAPKIKFGESALEIIKVSANGKEQYYLGEFKSSLLTAPWPGGFSPHVLPDLSPSRAYLKVLDGIDYAGATLAPGEHALEIGSSPGGATYALLEKGLSVEGIDPGEMSAICANHPKFFHHHTSIQDFKVFDLQDHVQWLFVDMNLPPEGALREIEKVVEKIRPSLKGAFITLKMTKFELVKRAPMYLTFVGNMGLKVVLATQLPSHKQEFLIYAE